VGVHKRRAARLVLVCAIAGAGAAMTVAAAIDTGRIGPDNRIQPNGRKLHPTGKLTRLGNAPAGGALTRNGRYLWTLSAGRGRNDIRIVEVRPPITCPDGPAGRRCRRHRRERVGTVVQRVVMPGLSGGIVMDPSRNTAYVSGLAESSHADEAVPAGVPGTEGDVIHVLTYDPRTGQASRDGLIPVPPPSNAPPYQTFPPQTNGTLSWPRDLAISPDGKTLLAALNLADHAAVIDTASRQVQYVEVGHYPYGAAITPTGKGLVSNESQGTVSVIDLQSATKTDDIQVAPRLSHPEGMVIDPRQPRAYVAIANEDQVAVIDTDTMSVQRTLSVARPQGTGTTPVHVSVTADGCYLIASDAGEDALAIFALPNGKGRTCHDPGRPRPKPYKLVGRIPTAAYPVAAGATPSGRRLAWVASKGLGVGPNPNGPDPNSPNDSDDHINSFQYLPSIVRGESGILPFPSQRRMRRLTPRADREVKPVNREPPPAGTPITPNGPIQHVFYIVKENRTYDQVLGDDPRGDGDPALTLFGEDVTPNLHALAQRFPLLDHVYADSEASIDGHYWTAAGAVSDYVIKNWPQNYAARGRPYDFGSYEVSNPPRGYIFERMLDAGVSFFNYGEALAGLNPIPNDKDRTQEDVQRAAQVLANSDIGTPQPGCYDSDLSNSTVLGQGQIQVYDSSLPPGAPLTAHSRFECFQTRFDAQLLAGTVPAFNYLVLPNNHTEGTTPGRRTPTAQIASNDWGLGQVVDLVSHSSIWDSSLILVLEDDSQDGADHVDAHRIPALAISPYARQGAVVHTRYDQLSFLRTAEIPIELPPINLAEALAVPLYDAFGAQPANDAPYDAITPNVDMTATNSASTPAAKRSAKLPLNSPDQIPQRALDRILWKYVHGQHSAPPPPGPNASGRDEDPGEDLPLPRVGGADSH
jgi:DNA-binding beta-propeller fold protein YncE